MKTYQQLEQKNGIDISLKRATDIIDKMPEWQRNYCKEIINSALDRKDEKPVML